MNFEGIQPPYVAFYQECIRFNCESAMESISFLADFIQMTNDTNGKYEIDGELQRQILDHIQRVCVHAAALSRYFWPSNDSNLHKKRADQLKDLYEISEDSPLKDRGLRNHLEHLDEKLDRYLENKSIVGVVLPGYVGGALDKTGVPGHIFRAFFIDTGIFEVLGIPFELQPIVDEICRIYGWFYASEDT